MRVNVRLFSPPRPAKKSSVPSKRQMITLQIAANVLLGAMALFSMPAPALASPVEDATQAKTADHRARTTVSLTFDDGFGSVEAARPLLARHGMHGTFYIPSGLVGQPGRLTWAQLQQMQAEGNEIGGHTVNHLHLETLDQAEQTRQICDDRVALSKHGLNVKSFAYPFDGFTKLSELIVKECGYNSARSEGGFASSDSCTTKCPYAETIPAADPYAVSTAAPVVTTTRVADIEQQITAAENHGGGWVPVVFHEVCDHCSDMAISPSDFDVLLDWLHLRASEGTVVETVGEVVGGQLSPAHAGPADTRPPGDLVNPSLEKQLSSAGTGPGPVCWQTAGFGINRADWSFTHSARTGSWAAQVAVKDYSSGDQKLIIREDSGSCSPAVVPGEAYALSAWYKSSVPVRMVVFYRTANGSWVYWAESPPTSPTASWQKISWQTPTAPEGATRVSFGLKLAAVGVLITDDYAMSPAPSFSPLGMLTAPRGGWDLGSVVAWSLAVVGLVPGLAFVTWRRVGKRRRTGSIA